MLDTREIAKALAPIVKEHVDAIVAPLRAEIAELKNAPKPENGKDADMRTVEQMIDERFKALPTPEVRAEDLDRVVAECVKSGIDALPKPKDGDPGKSLTIDDVRPLVESAVEKAVSALPKPEPGKDGVGAAGAMISREGHLVLTLTDGTTRDLGLVVGKDADMQAIHSDIDARFKALPRPEDGKDGLGFDDLDLVETDEGLELRFVRGDQVKAFPLPVVLDRGVYKEGSAYLKGAGVTWGGSFWIAQKDTEEKPGTGSGWRLAVKKGRDGKEVVKAEVDPKKPVKI